MAGRYGRERPSMVIDFEHSKAVTAGVDVEVDKILCVCFNVDVDIIIKEGSDMMPFPFSLTAGEALDLNDRVTHISVSANANMFAMGRNS